MSGQAGRKRNEASRQAILDATFALMQEDGFDSLSIEGVALRAGVGKTTIYRWWSGKGDGRCYRTLLHHLGEACLAKVDSGR